jgi:hypothetical protein
MIIWRFFSLYEALVFGDGINPIQGKNKTTKLDNRIFLY